MEISNKNPALQKQKFKIIIAGILMTLSMLAGIIPVLLVMQVFGELISDVPDLNNINFYLILMAVLLVLKAILYAVSLIISHIAAYQALADIRLLIVAHLKKLPVGFFQKKSSGELTKIINHDVEQVELQLAHALPDTFATASVPVLILIVALIIEWKMALALLLFLPLIALVMLVLSKWWRNMTAKYSRSLVAMSAGLMEFIATIPAIKAFSKEENRTAVLEEQMAEYQHWATRSIIIFTAPVGIMGILLESGLTAAIIIGALLLMSGQTGVEQFFMIIILGVAFCAALVKLAFIGATGITYKNSLQNINSILTEKPPALKPVSGQPDHYDLEFKNVYFSYQEDVPVLQNINLTLPQKSLTAIIGPSGSGKSTLAQLVMRFWLPQQGQISIGGYDIKKLPEEILAKLVSLVHQDVYLFNTTIAENIRLGKQGASDQAIIEVAKKARIDDFIQSLPTGYQTTVGERGGLLSGGQKQRISIARAILKDAPVIILDEATAAVDPYNEMLIHQAIQNLTKDKTVLVITHRISTVINADQIILLDHGKIDAQGTHQQLLATSQLYQELVQNQAYVEQWGLKGGAC